MVAVAPRGLVGRDEELRRLDAFVDAAAQGSKVMVLSGEAGIGKTSLLQAALRRARAHDFAVIEARPTEAERRLSFASLGDLFAGCDGEIGALAAPQRRALRTALLIEEPEGEP